MILSSISNYLISFIENILSNEITMFSYTTRNSDLKSIGNFNNNTCNIFQKPIQMSIYNQKGISTNPNLNL